MHTNSSIRELDNPTLVSIAKSHNKSPAQVMLRYLLQRKMVILPKSVNPKRQVENADLFDFELSEEDMDRLMGLDRHMTTGWDPTTLK